MVSIPSSGKASRDERRKTGPGTARPLGQHGSCQAQCIILRICRSDLLVELECDLDSGNRVAEFLPFIDFGGSVLEKYLHACLSFGFTAEDVLNRKNRIWVEHYFIS